MYKFLTKYGLLVAFGVGALFVVITYASILSGLPDGDRSVEVLLEEQNSAAFNAGIYITYFLIAVTTLVAILGFVMRTVSNPVSAKGFAIGTVGLLLLWAIIYFGFSDSAVTQTVIDNGLQPSDGVSTRIDSVIKLTYVLVILAAGSILFSSVRDFTK